MNLLEEGSEAYPEATEEEIEPGLQIVVWDRFDVSFNQRLDAVDLEDLGFLVHEAYVQLFEA